MNKVVAGEIEIGAVFAGAIKGLLEGLMFSSIPLRLFSAAKCLLTCLVKWSLLIKRRSHIEQTNFFSPVCVLLCRDSSSDRENCLSHPSHWQTNGFSPFDWIKFNINYHKTNESKKYSIPVCVLMWAFKWELL